MLSKYEIQARLVPALICSIPLLTFGYYFLFSIDANFVNLVITQTIGGTGMTVAVYLFIAFMCRHVGTWLQDLMFNNGDRFPTTLYLLEQDKTFSSERKQQIRKKIKQNFDIDLLNYTNDTAHSRQRISEAVSHIRKKFFGKNGLALQRNIEFGIAKNITGGSIVALTVCLVIIAISFATNLIVPLYFALILAATYTVLITFGLMAMGTNAKRYASALFEEYLAS